MNIVPQLDPSVNSAPTWYVNAINYTVQLFNDQFTNSMIAPINFGWGEVRGQAISGNLLASASNFSPVDYFTLKAGFAQGSQNSQLGSASMPPDDPTGGGVFRVSMALQKALGLIDGNAPDGYGTDGWVGLRSDVNWNPDFQSPPGSDQFDPAGELEHEISEVLGRIGVLGTKASPSGQPIFGPMDLYRWDFATGQRTFSPDTGSFSVNGQRILNGFRTASIGGDLADWGPDTSGDAFGNASRGVLSAFTRSDLEVMRALGYVAPTQGAIVNG